jgi:hypothetical protein
VLARRDDVYRAYWTFAAKRQQAFLARTAGAAPPWTDDAVIGRFKFTNAFRASDRVSQFLIRDVIYQPDFTADDTLARIVFFRLFSKISTWRELERTLGPVRRRTVSSPRLAPALEALQAKGPIYTSAFILCANDAYGYRRKFMNHIALVRHMFAGRALPTAVARARKLEDVYRALLAYPLIGPFMAYQLAIDINYSELVDFDEDDFTVAGPGAERGIRKVFPTAERRDLRPIIDWMTANQAEEARRVGVAAPTLFGRLLHAVDCQNLFCELDKYARVAFPELKSNRSRIKTSFTPTSEPLALFYPPKWRINERARAHQAGQAAQLALDVAA